MKLIRKGIFWSHLVAGTAAGIVVLIMSVTGVLLTYQRQITSWADTRSLAVIKPDGERLSAEPLLDRFRQRYSDFSVVSMTIASNSQSPLTITISGNRKFFVDPYTGEVLGEGSKGVRSFFRFVTDWHRWLGATGENRNAARAVTGASNLLFLFLVITGFYLWWPRKWSPAQLRNVTSFKRGLRGKARDFNWHNVIGLWSAVPLFIVVLSGVVISYPWASNLVYRVVGEAPPTQRTGLTQPPVGGANAGRPSREVSLERLDVSWSRAQQQVPGWRSINLRLPSSSEGPLVFTIDTGDGGQPQRRGTLTVDRATGNVVRWEPFSGLSSGRRLRSILRFAHTGEVAGIAGQTVAGLVSLGTVVLVWTGIALALRRLSSWRVRRMMSSLALRGDTGQETLGG